MGKKGRSVPGAFGTIHHYDEHGRKTGTSRPGFFGGYNHSDSEGCYVATCVYGSYHCPQVWTLRRFRDNTLGKKVLGRAFIHAYYAISPTIVKWFGKTVWFKKLWCGVLDKMVQKLHDKGVEDTPYCDRNWRGDKKHDH